MDAPLPTHSLKRLLARRQAVQQDRTTRRRKVATRRVAVLTMVAEEMTRVVLAQVLVEVLAVDSPRSNLNGTQFGP